MDIYKHAQKILSAGTIDEKMEFIKLDDSFKNFDAISVPSIPARVDKIKFSDKKFKFPKAPSMHLDDKKAAALHTFANHELQALEMMAAGIIMFPTETQEDHEFKLDIMRTMQDEKKHFLLYRKRMNELGMDFGDLPVNNFFWKQLSKIETKSQYYTFIALILEAANLDFAKYYSNVFASIEDFKTSEILDIVYEDEIRHVAAGRQWLNQWRGSKNLWEYFIENLPEMMTPARAKGMIFDREGRQRAGLDDDFIDRIVTYRDDFAVTDRKSWK